MQSRCQAGTTRCQYGTSGDIARVGPHASSSQIERQTNGSLPHHPWVSEPPAPHFISQTPTPHQPCRREGRGRERGSFGGAEPAPNLGTVPRYVTKLCFTKHRCCFWYARGKVGESTASAASNKTACLCCSRRFSTTMDGPSLEQRRTIKHPQKLDQVSCVCAVSLVAKEERSRQEVCRLNGEISSD